MRKRKSVSKLCCDYSNCCPVCREKKICCLFGRESHSRHLAEPNEREQPNISENKHWQDVQDNDIQCHPRTETNESMFLSIKAAVCNVASDLRGCWTPWHQTQYHVMVSPWALINTRQSDRGQSSGHYHSSQSGLVCLFADGGERILKHCPN